MYTNIFLEKVNIKVLLGTVCSRKSKRRSDKAVNAPQAGKERTFHVHMFVETLCIVDLKYVLPQCLILSFVLKFFLIFHQISGSCYF